jgi:uncharacterized protein (TIGR01244 family)
MRQAILLATLVLPFFACSSSSPETAHTTAAALPGIADAKQEGDLVVAGLPSIEGYDALAAAHPGAIVVSNLSDEEAQQRLGFDEEQALRERGLTFVQIPLGADRIERADVDRFAAVMADANGRTVLVHCASGNRAGGLYAAYLALHRGVPLEDALAQAKSLGLSKGPTVDAVRTVVADGTPR